MLNAHECLLMHLLTVSLPKRFGIEILDQKFPYEKTILLKIYIHNWAGHIGFKYFSIVQNQSKIMHLLFIVVSSMLRALPFLGCKHASIYQHVWKISFLQIGKINSSIFLDLLLLTASPTVYTGWKTLATLRPVDFNSRHSWTSHDIHSLLQT